MAIFKESQIKNMLNHVQTEQITFSRMVELLNQQAYKELAYKGKLVIMEDIIITLEAFLVQNEPVKNQVELKTKDFISYIKSQIIDQKS